MKVSLDELKEFKESRGLELEETQVFPFMAPIWACTNADKLNFNDPYDASMPAELLIWANDSI